VIAARPYSSSTRKHAIDRARQTDLEPRNAESQRIGVIGFHYQVQVIVLNGEVQHAKRCIRRRSEGPPDHREELLLAQRCQTASGPQGDVDREGRTMLDATPVLHRRAIFGRPAAGTPPGAAPRARSGELQLSGAAGQGSFRRRLRSAPRSVARNEATPNLKGQQTARCSRWPGKADGRTGGPGQNLKGAANPNRPSARYRRSGWPYRRWWSGVPGYSSSPLPRCVFITQVHLRPKEDGGASQDST
jgi:hypothetical protein